MKLALKVVLSTVFGTLLVLIAFGYFRARKEVAVFDQDMRKDHTLIGATLGVCVASTWASAGEQRALELIDRADAERPGLRIGWIHSDGSQSARAPVFAWKPPGDFRTTDHSVTADPNNPARSFLVTRVPVRGPNGLLGAIEIAESLEIRTGYLRSAAASTLYATFGTFLISGVVALVLGVWLVGRPLRLLTLKAQRVGGGDLGGPLDLPQKDEIGVLAAEVNSMCERLAEANARTQAETQARYRALEQLRHADRLITVGRLAAGVAHELGTPLNVIAGRAKMLRRGDVDPASAQEYLTVISEQAERTTSIIRQLMDFARRREPRMISTDLLSVTRSIVSLVEPLARRRRLTVRAISTCSVLTRGDATQIEQVVSNLVVNAMQACKDGGSVEVSCGVADSGANGVAINGSARCAYVRVTDDGHGMPPETVEHVFEPFFTTKDVGQGTGLGLSVAHGIVRDHGGAIAVESAVGRGSQFTVYLPLVQS
jgi:signal transduction histidine kinase